MNAVLIVENLFDWLLERSWQGAVLAISIVLVQRALGAALPAKWRYGFWFVLLGVLLLPSLPESPLSIYNALPKARTTAVPVGPLIALPIKQDDAPPATSGGQAYAVSSEKESGDITESPSAWQWLAMIWAGTAGMGLGFLLLINIRFARRIRSLAEVADTRTREIFCVCKKELGIRRSVRLVEAPAVASPAITGFFRPTLLVPTGFAHSLEPAEMRYVFLHELGHLVRGDVQVNVLLAVIQAVHWFNPLLWWAFRQMRADRELACDALVLARVDIREGGGYGETLLKLMGRFRPGRRGVGLVGILENHRALKARIERIAAFSAASRAWSFAGAAVILGLSVFFLTAAKNPKSAAANFEAPALPEDPAVGRICDRHGVLLAEYRIDDSTGKPRNRPIRYPLGAFAAQLLESLDESALPKPGETIRLTIDARIQMIAEQELRKVGRGAAVVLDPNNGDILAMASVPSFDPNKFVPAIDEKDWQELSQDKTSPLLNRALTAYTPGSVYKPVTALAGATMGLESKRYTCKGGVEIGNAYFKCWSFANGGHGELSLADALKVSCNPYFYEYGIAAGDRLQTMADRLGMGKTSGIPVRGEAAGVVDGPDHLKKVNPRDSWRDILSANVAIGMGAVQATPLQLAGMMEAIGNGGTLYWPRLVKSVTRSDPGTLEQPEARVRTNLLSDGVTPTGLESVRTGLWKVVNEDGGTARKAAVSGLDISGKTGTAQVWRIDGDQKIADNNVWFAGFAPFKNPRYAFAILVQGASSGGGVPAPLAAGMLRRFEDRSELFVPKMLKAASGNFKVIDRPSAKGEVENVSSNSPTMASINDHVLPIAQRTPGKSGMVVSPFSGQLVDVSAYPSGEVVKDPYSGRQFKVP